MQETDVFSEVTGVLSSTWLCYTCWAPLGLKQPHSTAARRVLTGHRHRALQSAYCLRDNTTHTRGNATHMHDSGITTHTRVDTTCMTVELHTKQKQPERHWHYNAHMRQNHAHYRQCKRIAYNATANRSYKRFTVTRAQSSFEHIPHRNNGRIKDGRTLGRRYRPTVSKP